MTPRTERPSRPSRRRRVTVTPSFVVAVVALVLAASGAGYAAGKVGAKQIKNNAITSSKIKNHSVKAADLAPRAVGRAQLAVKCPAGEVAVDAMCTTKASSGPSSFAAAESACAAKGGRLPTLAELWMLAENSQVQWANGMGNQYEYSSSISTATTPPTFEGLDRMGDLYQDTAGQSFWHHCLLAP